VTGERGVLLGFPFETVDGEGVRAELMARTLAWFGVEAEPPGLDDDGEGGLVGLCGCRAGGGARGGWQGSLVVVLLAGACAGFGRRRVRNKKGTSR
jgi:hypothetical protein